MELIDEAGANTHIAALNVRYLLNAAEFIIPYLSRCISGTIFTIFYIQLLHIDSGTEKNYTCLSR